jgi:anti-anti-sigma factor
MDRRKRIGHDTVYSDRQLVVRRTLRPSGLVFIGALDNSNVERVAEILAAALNGHSDPEVHIDLTNLEFADVSGIRALVAAAEKADGSHRMILHGLPPLMKKVMGVVGWSDLPTLFIAETDFPEPDPSTDPPRDGEPSAEVG